MYLVVDHSASMEPYADSLKLAINMVVLRIISNPFLRDMCRVSIVGFGSYSGTIMHLSDLNDDGFCGKLLQALNMMGAPDYRYVLEELCTRIASDVTTLRADHYGVFRPAVIFLTNGSHCGDTSGWLTSRQKLLDQPWRPNIIAIGIGPSREETLQSLSTTDRHGNSLAFVRHEDKDMNLANSVFEIVMSLFETNNPYEDRLDEDIETLEMPVPSGFRIVDMEEI